MESTNLFLVDTSVRKHFTTFLSEMVYEKFADIDCPYSPYSLAAQPKLCLLILCCSDSGFVAEYR